MSTGGTHDKTNINIQYILYFNKNEVNTVYGNIILRDDKYKPAIRLLQVSKEYPVLDLSNRIINVGNMELIKAAMWSDSEIRNKYKKFYNTVTNNE